MYVCVCVEHVMINGFDFFEPSAGYSFSSSSFLTALGAVGVRMDRKHRFLSVNRISLSCKLAWISFGLNVNSLQQPARNAEKKEKHPRAIEPRSAKKLKIPIYETINWLHLSRRSSSELMFRFFLASFEEFSARKQKCRRARLIGWESDGERPKREKERER